LRQSEGAQERWCLPELLRLQGELQWAEGATGADIEEQYGRSTAWARRQGALSWELRTATSLANLRISEGRHADARAALATVRAMFTEGFQTSDLKAADAVLDRLSWASDHSRD
jgi:predicted ATPase